MNRQHVNVAGHRWNCAEAGQGTPVLLVHGFPLDHTMWQPQLDALSATSRLIAPDLPGFGGTAPAGEVMTMPQFADGLAALLDQLGVQEPVVFCGLSMGGYIAWEFWRRYRQRVAKLVLCDTRAAADTPEAARARRVAARRIDSEGKQPFLSAMVPKLMCDATRNERAAVVAHVDRMTAAAHPQGVAAALRGMAQRTDSIGLLGDIDVPALLLVGDQDEISPVAEMQAMAAAMPHARLRVISDAGHLAPLENPPAVNKALADFIRNA